MEEHSKRCNELAAAYIKAIGDYMDKWPKYCRECGGGGIIAWIENGAPHGAGYWPMPMEGSCEACLGTCPRCEEEIDEDVFCSFYEDATPCPWCGWNWGKGKGDYAPAEPECLCWVEEYEVDLYSQESVV